MKRGHEGCWIRRLCDRLSSKGEDHVGFRLGGGCCGNLVGVIWEDGTSPFCRVVACLWHSQCPERARPGQPLFEADITRPKVPLRGNS